MCEIHSDHITGGWSATRSPTNECPRSDIQMATTLAVEDIDCPSVGNSAVKEPTPWFSCWILPPTSQQPVLEDGTSVGLIRAVWCCSGPSPGVPVARVLRPDVAGASEWEPLYSLNSLAPTDERIEVFLLPPAIATALSSAALILLEVAVQPGVRLRDAQLSSALTLLHVPREQGPAAAISIKAAQMAVALQEARAARPREMPRASASRGRGAGRGGHRTGERACG